MISNICCYQLTAKSKLTKDNYRQLAQLVYRTDEYIYPCIFNSESDAITVFANLLQSNHDAMFSKDNCFVAATSSGNILGMILWKKGSLVWDDVSLKSQAKLDGVKLSPYFDLVKQRYFTSYENNAPDQITLINVSVDSAAQGQGIGSIMIENFVQEHKNEEMELYVLADNAPAIQLYSKHAQFEKIATIQGFSYDQRELPCLVMQRSPNE